MNECLLLKWWWRFGGESAALWKQVILSKYPQLGGSRWPVQEVNSRWSMVWRDILGVAVKCPELLEFFKANSRISIGDGRLTKFWMDLWLGSDCLKNLFPRLFSVSMHKGESLAVVKSRSTDNEDWGLVFRRVLFQWELDDLRRLKELLRTAPELRNGVADGLFWSADKSGSFTVNSVYKWCELSPTLPANLKDLIWRNAAPPKVQFLGWLVWKGRIKTTSYLQRIGAINADSDVSCKFCRNELETATHVLLCCPFSWRVWSNIIGWWGVSWVQPGSLTGLFQWWSGFRCKNRLKVLWKILPLAVFWSLWKQRNEITFGDSHVDFKKLCELIKTRIALWFRAYSPSFCYSVNDLVFNLQSVNLILAGILHSNSVSELGCAEEEDSKLWCYLFQMPAGGYSSN
ncbi:uncharacterized protein LOC114286504 [Camellia sinensis]|uniref:uncharacterized protein LOC114286504 n=1 Tax=Camellia sinensis TaxID=4442 RepID=UPI001035B3FD|nr:uncharacterized protein LOC114286504 [Camellia sinensis]